jgi:ribosomal protein L25 (general stress protein Ctc)
MSSLRSCVLLRRTLLSASRRALSSETAAARLAKPEKLVSGLTSQQVEASPEIAEFLKANFGQDDDAITDGYVIPPEILKEYGIELEQTAEETIRAYDVVKVDAGLGTAEQQAMNMRTMHTYLRQEEGTNQCNRLRYHKLIPGMLYGSDSNQGISSLDKSTRIMIKTPWAELQRELDRFHRSFESRVYDLTIYEDETDTEGTVHPVIPRDVQRHPVQGKVYCSNFLRYYPGRPVKIPIVYINTEESPALKRNGFIVPVNKFVECIVEDGVPVPGALELECTGVMIKDVIRIDRIIFPDGVRPSDRVDVEKFLVGPVQGGRGAAADDDEEGDEVEK